MSMIPEVKCRRCGETFSSMRTRCPNCGTRRVTQSSRTPGTTPGTVRGTASYERAEANTKWQMIFGLILVVAVILAVIVMVSTSLNATDADSGTKMTAPPITSALPSIETAPTPSPTATPTVERIEIKYIDQTLSSDPAKAVTMQVGNDPLPVTAYVYPLSIQGATVTWSSEDESVLRVIPGEGNSAKIEILAAKAGGVKIYAECFGVKGECLIYCAEAAN